MASGTHKAVYAALAGNLAIAVTKGIAAALTGSSAMLTEALHSLIDTGNEGLLLIGLRRASRPPDETHPFGYGLEVYFWAFVVALLIFSLGGGLAVYQGIQHIRHPPDITQPWINFVVLGLAFVFESFSFRVAWREFAKARRDVPVLTAISRSKDPALFSVLLEDGAALVGLVVAALGLAATLWLDWPWADGAASVLIGLVLIIVAVFMANETRSLMSGEAAAPRTVAAVRALLEADPAIEKVHEVMTMHLGPSAILLAITLDYRDDLPIREAEEVTARFSAQIRKLDSRIGRIFVRSAHSLSGAGAI
ncbi:MAG TPA: cation diffusion facilitator family transporter [Rhizomicrobium sp.]|jgi:cation diffusion facilitator family transporter|nr:cation diffusion facilitator family transporter [Rhizomicrobium sp.]